LRLGEKEAGRGWAALTRLGGDAEEPEKRDAARAGGNPGLKPGAISLLPRRGAGRAWARTAEGTEWEIATRDGGAIRL
jgi:hypothetical protein